MRTVSHAGGKGEKGGGGRGMWVGGWGGGGGDERQGQPQTVSAIMYKAKKTMKDLCVLRWFVVPTSNVTIIYQADESCRVRGGGGQKASGGREGGGGGGNGEGGTAMNTAMYSHHTQNNENTKGHKLLIIAIRV